MVLPLNPNRPLEPKQIFLFVEQTGCLSGAGVAGYVKLQRQPRCRQENKRCWETTQKQEVIKHCGLKTDWGLMCRYFSYSFYGRDKGFH